MEEPHFHQKGRNVETQLLLLSSSGFLTDERGAGTLNSKERDEVTGSGCHLGLLETLLVPVLPGERGTWGQERREGKAQEEGKGGHVPGGASVWVGWSWWG